MLSPCTLSLRRIQRLARLTARVSQALKVMALLDVLEELEELEELEQPPESSNTDDDEFQISNFQAALPPLPETHTTDHSSTDPGPSTIMSTSRKRDNTCLSSPPAEGERQGDATRQRVAPPPQSSPWAADMPAPPEWWVEQEAAEIEASKSERSTPKPDSEHPVENRWDDHMRIAIADGTFSPRYRLRPDKFFKVLDILGSALLDADSPTRTDKGMHIPPKVKLMAALRICAPRSGAHAVMDCFGVTKSMCRRWLRQVILAVLDKKKECRKAGLRPSTLKEMERLADNNFRLGGEDAYPHGWS